MIILGNKEIKDIRLGDKKVLQVFKGEKLVWPTQTIPSIDTNGYDYVDMGEAGIWASCNVGASKPEEYGLYFEWGGTIGYPDTSDKRFNTSGSDYIFGPNPTKYNEGDGLTALELEDDAAHVNMGGSWRTPTYEAFKKLNDLCNSQLTYNYNSTGIAGRIFKLKTDESKQLFFPAAGEAYNGQVKYTGTQGNYLSNKIQILPTNSTGIITIFSFNSAGVYPGSGTGRFGGYSVRGFIPKQS